VTAPSVREAWNSAAAGWDAGFDWYARNLASLAAWFCDRVASPGARVLDVACGTGLPAIAIAAKVGPIGHVVATDIAPQMLAAVGRRAGKEGLSNLDLREMDAQSLEFEAGSFDAVTCSCGLMLFADPVAALGEMRRVLVPGGCLAVAVWAQPADNPFFTIPAAAVSALFPPADSNRKPPNGYSLGAPGQLDRTLAAAGLGDISVERIALTVELDSLDEYWRLYTSFVPGLADRLGALPAADIERARTILASGAAPFGDGRRFWIGITALCGIARAR